MSRPLLPARGDIRIFTSPLSSLVPVASLCVTDHYRQDVDRVSVDGTFLQKTSKGYCGLCAGYLKGT